MLEQIWGYVILHWSWLFGIVVGLPTVLWGYMKVWDLYASSRIKVKDRKIKIDKDKLIYSLRNKGKELCEIRMTIFCNLKEGITYTVNGEDREATEHVFKWGDCTGSPKMLSVLPRHSDAIGWLRIPNGHKFSPDDIKNVYLVVNRAGVSEILKKKLSKRYYSELFFRRLEEHVGTCPTCNGKGNVTALHVGGGEQK